jgi:hypothetical protein
VVFWAFALMANVANAARSGRMGIAVAFIGRGKNPCRCRRCKWEFYPCRPG